MPRTREEAEALARRLKIPDAEMEEFIADQTANAAPEPEVAPPQVETKTDPPSSGSSSSKSSGRSKSKSKYDDLVLDIPPPPPPPPPSTSQPLKYSALAEPTIGNAPTFHRSMPEGSLVGRAVRAVEAVIAPPPPVSNMAEIRKQDAAVYRPDDAFRADYDYLVGQGYPAQSLDAVIADPARGAAAIAKLAKAKREGKL